MAQTVPTPDYGLFHRAVSKMNTVNIIENRAVRSLKYEWVVS